MKSERRKEITQPHTRMRHVFTFGCPRSGTTYLWKMMRQLNSDTLYVDRIKEANPLHPCNSRDGLLGLAAQFPDAVFVRIERDPVDVFESFYGKRSELSKNPWHGVNDEERIYEFIINERINTRRQRMKHQKDKPDWPFNLIEIVYEDLHTRGGQTRVVKDVYRHLGPKASFFVESHLAETWMKVPSREGRLSLGITESLLPGGMADEIRERVNEALREA